MEISRDDKTMAKINEKIHLEIQKPLTEEANLNFFFFFSFIFEIFFFLIIYWTFTITRFHERKVLVIKVV